MKEPLCKIEKKPPLGVRPAWLAAWTRIGELIGAIERQYESPHGDSELVEKWANEITYQCMIIQAFDDKGGQDDQNIRSIG